MSPPRLLGLIAAILLATFATACRDVVGSLDIKKLATDAETTVELEADREYTIWEDISYELRGPHREPPVCFRYRIEALQAGKRVAALDCTPFRLSGPCAGGTSRGPSGESGDCRVGNCTLKVASGGTTTLRAGVHPTSPCDASAQPRFFSQPEFSRLTLRLGK